MKCYRFISNGLLAIIAVQIGWGEDLQKDTTFALSPVVVTATQAVARLTPATFSDYTREQIVQRYSVQDIPVLLSELPSITTYSENGNGIGYNYINLRGFDQRRLSVMINGVPQNDPEDHNVYWLDFPDLMANTSDIQVQRGAGSAFYGSPAIGGSINFTTNPFGKTPGMSFESMFGFQEFGDSVDSPVLTTRKFSASINSGLLDQKYLLYGRLSRITSDGYRYHSWVDFDSYFLGAVRFDEHMSTRVHIYGGPITDGLAYAGLPKYYNANKILRRSNLSYWEFDTTGKNVGYSVTQKPQAVESFSQPHYELMHYWEVTPTIKLYNAFFHVRGDGYFDFDGDWIYSDLSTESWFKNIIGYDTTGWSAAPPSFLLRSYVGNRQWGWLPRIEILHSDGQLIVGAEVRYHRSTHWGKIAYASELPSSTFDPDFHFYEYNGGKDIVSVFGHELYKPNEQTTVMLDLQLVHNRYLIEHEKFLNHSFSLSYLFLNPRCGVNCNFTDELSGYVSFAYTEREPRLKEFYAAEEVYSGAKPLFRVDTSRGIEVYDYSKPFAKPEQLFNFEFGSCYSSRNLNGTVNLFWMEFMNELVKTGRVDVFGQPVTSNASRTRHLGIELNGQVELPYGLGLSGNITYSRNRLIDYQVVADSTGATRALDGNPIAGFPDLLGNIRVSYRNGGLNVSVMTKYVGPFYTDNFATADNKNDAYVATNAELLVSFPLWIKSEITLRGEVRNVFNSLYTMSGEGNAFFPAAERNYLVGVSLSI